MRPVFISERPNFIPYTCIVCGLGGPPRTYFIDLGFDIDAKYMAINDGGVYLCNECFRNKIDEAEMRIVEWTQEHDLTYRGEDRVDASYEWTKNLDLSTVEAQHGIGDFTKSDGNDQSASGDDQESESDDSVSTGTSKDESDDADESDVAAFNAIFTE
jgi:hypothetical protein